jgi:hypothetical protein
MDCRTFCRFARVHIHSGKEAVMDKEMTRREFLNATAVTGTVLLAGNVFPGFSPT